MTAPTTETVRLDQLLTPLGQGSPKLAQWFRKLISDPGNVKLAMSGDSTSNGSSGPSPFLYARLAGISLQSTSIPKLIHTARGEGLYGMTADVTHVIDAGNSGETLAHLLAYYDANISTAKTLRWLIAQAPDLIILSWGVNDVRLGGTTKAQLVAMLNRLVTILRRALPGTDIVLRVPSYLSTDDYGANHYVQDAQGNINPAGAAQAYSDLLRSAYYAVADRWPNVVLADVPAAVTGLVSIAVGGTYMGDQLHLSQAGQYAYVDWLVQNVIGYYPSKRLTSAVSYSPVKLAPYAPWTVDPAVLDDVSRFALLLTAPAVTQGAGYIDYNWAPAATVTNGDIVRLPDGQVFQLPASGVSTTQNSTTTRLLATGLPTSATLSGQVRIYRQILTGDTLVNNVLADSSWRFKRTGRITAGSTTGMTIRAASNGPNRATQPASEWATVMAAGDVVYVEGDGANSVTLAAGQFAASSTNLALTGLASGTDYSTLIGRMVVIVGTHTDGVAGAQGPVGPAGGLAAPLLSGVYANPAVFGNAATGTLTLNSGYAVPMVFQRDGQIDRLAVEAATAVAGATCGLALYADSTTSPGRPGALLADFTAAGASNVDCSTAGFKESPVIASPVAVTGGTRYWAVVAVQGTAASGLRTIGSSFVSPMIAAPAASLGFCPSYTVTIAGAMPANWTGNSVGSAAPWVRARAV